MDHNIRQLYYYYHIILSYQLFILHFRKGIKRNEQDNWIQQSQNYSVISKSGLCAWLGGEKNKSSWVFLGGKQCRIHLILSAFNKEQANDLPFCVALLKCSHQKMKDRIEISAAEPWFYIVIKIYRFQTLYKELYSYLAGIINNYSTLN